MSVGDTLPVMIVDHFSRSNSDYAQYPFQKLDRNAYLLLKILKNWPQKFHDLSTLFIFFHKDVRNARYINTSQSIKSSLMVSNSDNH